MIHGATEDGLRIDKAILRWSDPRLVEAVRVAEARFILHDLAEFYRLTGGFRFPLLPAESLRQPQTGDGWAGPPSFERLSAAWKALEADFRQRLATDIHLRGVQISPNPETQPTSIQQAWASDAKFDMTRGVLEVAGRRYAAVSASIAPPSVAASAPPNTPSAPITDPGESRISLKDARFLRAPTELTANYQALYAQAQIAKAIDAGHVPKGYETAPAHVWLTPTPDMKQEMQRQFAVAAAALDADFRFRIERVEIKLVGLQLKPTLGTEPVTLPPIWASRMVFDWERQSVQVQGTLFVEVWAQLTVVNGPVADRPRVGRGRPAFPFERMVAIAKDRLSLRAATNGGEAKALLAEFARLHPGLAKPAFSTVIDHVAEIYRTAAAGAVPIKPIK